MDGLEADLIGRAQVIRIDILSEPGRAIAASYGVRSVPAFLVLDRSRNIIMTQAGLPQVNALREAALLAYQPPE